LNELLQGFCSSTPPSASLKCSLQNRLSVLIQEDLGFLQQFNTGIQLGEEFLDLVDYTVLFGKVGEG